MHFFYFRRCFTYMTIVLLGVFFLAGCTDRSEKIQSDAPKYRIVTAYRPATQMVLALQASKFLVGVHKNAQNLSQCTALIPGLEKIPQVGDKSTGLNLETIVALKPGLVVLFPGTTGIQQAQKLSQFGIDSELIEMESLAQMESSLLKLGKRLELEANAQNTIGEMRRIVKIVDDHLAKQTLPKIKVYFSSSRELLTTHSNTMLQHEMIVRAGGQDVISNQQGNWITVSLEQLIVWDPDIVIISGSASYSVETITGDPRFRQLRAIQSGKIYAMPESRISSWDFPGPDSVLGILWLARMCYPELFKDVDWEAEKDRYYRTVYGVSYKTLMSIEKEGSCQSKF